MSSESTGKKEVIVEQYVRQWAIFELFILLGLPFMIFDLAKESSFSEASMSQYGCLVLVLFVGASFSTLVGLLKISFSEKEGYSVLGALVLGYAIHMVWYSSKSDITSKFDFSSFLVAISTICLAISTFYIYKKKIGSVQEIYLRHLQINLFLALGVVMVVVCRYLFYDMGTESYLNWLAGTFKRPATGATPEWIDRQTEITSGLRANFWSGFSTGVIAVQLYIAQIINIFSDIFHGTIISKDTGNIT